MYILIKSFSFKKCVIYSGEKYRWYIEILRMIKVHATLISELVIDIEDICSSKGWYIFFLFLPFVLPFIFLLFCLYFFLFLSTLVVYCPRYPETLIGRYLLGTNLKMGLVSKRYLPFRRIVFPPALSTSLMSTEINRPN